MLRQYILLAIFLLAAGAAGAQTPLDWTDAQGGIQCPQANADWTAGAVLTCRVRIPSLSWSLTTTCAPGATKAFAVPVRASTPQNAFAECEVDLLPGVYGASTPATPVSLRGFSAPAAPGLVP